MDMVEALILEHTLRETYEVAALAHAGHARKGSLAPYVTHPLAVMSLLVDVGVQDGTVLQAALLHDVVENSDHTAGEIRARFGAEVAGLVAELTRPAETRQDRAAFGQYLERLSVRAGLIKLADRIENVRGLLTIRNDPGFVEQYLDETRELFLAPWIDRMHAELAGMLRAAFSRAEHAHTQT